MMVQGMRTRFQRRVEHHGVVFARARPSAEHCGPECGCVGRRIAGSGRVPPRYVVADHSAAPREEANTPTEVITDEKAAKDTPPACPFYAGQQVDAQDQHGKWYEATVCAIRTHPALQVYVHYTYWSSRWDEWIEVGPGVPVRVTKAGESGQVYAPGKPARKGMLVDVFDSHPSNNRFIDGKIIDVSPEGKRVLVHFVKYSSAFDAWFDLDGGLVRPFGERTRRKYPYRIKVKANAGDGSSSSSGSGHRRQLQAGSDGYTAFLDALAAKSFTVVPQAGDGNCLFRSVAHQVYGNPELHSHIRATAVAYLELNSEWLAGFIDGEAEGVREYLEMMARNGVWGGEHELVAFHEVYKRPIEIFAGSAEGGARVIMTYRAAAVAADAVPIRLSYYGGGHYDSIVGSDSARAVLPVGRAGTIERVAIEAARRRLSETTSAEAGDESLAAAIAASHEEFESALMLDQALQMSRAEGPTMSSSSSSAAAAAATTTGDVVMDPRAVDQMMISQAIEMSRTAADEEALLEAARLASMPPDSSHVDEDALLEVVLAESAQTGGLSEEEQLRRAVEASMGPTQSDEELQRAVEASMGAQNNTDEELEQALRLSAIMAGSSDDQEASARIEDEEMRLAILASLQH
jgi:hypothetical protein